MKKILLVLAILLAVAVVGVAIFIATFDADRYRPQLVSELEKAIGRPVRVERISLGWNNGIAIRLQGLAIDEDAAKAEPLLKVDLASALVRLLPLLRKEVEVSSVVLTRPTIHVARDAQGNINLLGLAAVAGPAAASSRATTPDGAAVSLSVDSLRLEGGALHWTDATTNPPTDLWVKALEVTVKNIAVGQPLDVDVSGALAGEIPNMRFIGRVMLPSSTSPGSLEQATLRVDQVPLDRFLPPSPSGEPQLHGTFSTTLEGGTATLDPAQLVRSVSGEGKLKLADGTITNLNILREVFTKFSMIPGLVEKLQTRLPEEYQAKLNAKETALSPIDVSMRVVSGTLQFDQLDVRADTFGLSGRGSLGWDGTLNVRATLRVDSTLSTAIVQSVHELQSLANARGELEIPLAIQGQGTRLAVLPDLNYIASKVLVTTAVDLLGQLLKKGERTESDAAGSGQTESSQGGLLGQFLQRALEKQSSSDVPPQPAQP